MARYIDADKLKERIQTSPLFGNFGQDGYFIKEFVIDLIDRQSAEMKKDIQAYTVRKMQEAIEERCIKGGIYPVFVKRTIERVAEDIIGGTKDEG